MLIDFTYFTRPPRKVKSLTLGTPGAPLDPNARIVQEFVRNYIDFYEPRYLEKMFGEGNRVSEYVFNKDRNATVFDSDMEELCKRLREPCADYVYYWLLRDIISQTTIDGEIRTKLNDLYVSPMSKQVTAWNDMAELNRGLSEWLQTSGKYPGIEVSEYMKQNINPFNL